MFDIYGVPPFDEKEKKISSRTTQAEATDYARNLANFGYKNLRVVEAGTPQPVPVPTTDSLPQPQPAPAPAQPADNHGKP